jgi:hypothetical protein
MPFKEAGERVVPAATAVMRSVDQRRHQAEPGSAELLKAARHSVVRVAPGAA